GDGSLGRRAGEVHRTHRARVGALEQGGEGHWRPGRVGRPAYANGSPWVERRTGRATPKEDRMYVSALSENAEFDYVIVGAGSAGCAVAGRLAADGRHQVLLLEAGGRDDNHNIHVPLMVANVLNDTR